MSIKKKGVFDSRLTFILIIGIVAIIFSTFSFSSMNVEGSPSMNGTITPMDKEVFSDQKCLGIEDDPCSFSMKINPNPTKTITIPDLNFSNNLHVIATYENGTIIDNLTGLIITEKTIINVTIYKDIEDNGTWSATIGGTTIGSKFKGYSPDEFFTTLIENKADIDKGYAIYIITNPTQKSIKIHPKDLTYNFMNSRGNEINSYTISINSTVNKTVIHEDISCLSYNKSNTIPMGINCTKFINYTQISYEDYMPFGNQFTLEPNTSVKIRIDATWNPRIGDQAKDWIPNINISGSTLKQSKWAWWNVSFGKCMDYTINTNDTMTDQPVLIVVPFQSGMNDTFNDVRFVNASCDDGGSSRSYWIRNYTASSAADIWVNVSSLTNGAVVGVYFNFSVQNVSNYNTTFSFADDWTNFPQSSIDTGKWITGGTGTTTVTGGFLNISSTTENWYGLKSFNNFSANYTVEFQVKGRKNSGVPNGYNKVVGLQDSLHFFDSGRKILTIDTFGAATYRAYREDDVNPGGATDYSRGELVLGPDHVIIYFNGTRYNFTENDTGRVSNQQIGISSSTKPNIAVFGNSGQNEMYMNWIYLYPMYQSRQYPTGSFGSVESLPPNPSIGCVYNGTGDWIIDSICQINTSTNIGSNVFKVQNTTTINGSAIVTTSRVSVENNSILYILIGGQITTA